MWASQCTENIKMYTILQDNKHAYEEGSAEKLLTGLCNRKFGSEHRARVLSTPRGYSPVTMVTLICGHMSGRSLATQPETEEKVDGAGTPPHPCAPGPPRHRGARVRAVGLRGNGGAVLSSPSAEIFVPMEMQGTASLRRSYQQQNQS